MTLPLSTQDAPATYCANCGGQVHLLQPGDDIPCPHCGEAGLFFWLTVEAGAGEAVAATLARGFAE